MSQVDLDHVRRSITSTVTEINATRARLGIPDIDDEDRMEVMDILHRIERKLGAHAKESAA